MINYHSKDNYFEFVESNPKCKIILYGAGNEGRKNYKNIGHIDFFCDQSAESIGKIDDITCLHPKELEQIKDKMIILICIRQKSIVNSICELLGTLQIDAEVFSFFDNPAFPMFDGSAFRYSYRKKDKLKIRIIYLNDGWILGKFAKKLQEELYKLGQEVDIAEVEDPEADINHYVFYGDLSQICSGIDTVRTVMVTHVDSLRKMELIKFQTQNNVVDICMSSDTVNRLSTWGISRDKICYVNPAQDGKIKPKKIVLGITNRCYENIDFRKRDDLIVKVCEQLDPDSFKIRIMGEGWDKIVEQLLNMKFEVDYYAEFDPELYKELMPSLDYWIYYGFDEGAMGYLDALAAGVKTITTPQGYHLDTKCGLTFPCKTIEDFVSVLKEIQNERKKITDAVKDWTWENYAKKHLEIWQYLTGTKTLKELFAHQSEYMDGIFSLLISDIMTTEKNTV